MDVTLGIGDIIHGVKNESPYEDKFYLNPGYTLEDVATYQFELTCDTTVMRHVDAALKEPYCQNLDRLVSAKLGRKFPKWKTALAEERPDLKVITELEAAWGGENQKFKITVETIVHITIIRWDTVVAEHRLKWGWNSDSVSRNLKMYNPGMTNDKAFKRTSPNVAKALVNFIAEPATFKKEEYVEPESEDY